MYIGHCILTADVAFPPLQDSPRREIILAALCKDFLLKLLLEMAMTAQKKLHNAFATGPVL
jgi:hypothetical protein